MILFLFVWYSLGIAASCVGLRAQRKYYDLPCEIDGISIIVLILCSAAGPINWVFAFLLLWRERRGHWKP